LKALRALLLTVCSLVTVAAGMLWIAYVLPSLTSDLSKHRFVLTSHPLPRSTVRLEKKVPKLNFMVTIKRHMELLSQYEYDSDLPGHPPRIKKPFEGRFRILGVKADVWDSASIQRIPRHPTNFARGAFTHSKQFESVIFLDVPLWLVFFVFGAYPALVLTKGIVRRRRRKRGQCPKCGYNLTGNTSGVCPECGT
jgi:hypothetical protein